MELLHRDSKLVVELTRQVVIGKGYVANPVCPAGLAACAAVGC